QPSPKLSQASAVTPRAPSIVHIAISKAPVSEPGTMPIRCVSGSCSISRIRSMQYCRRALPSFERCERPSDSVLSFSGDQPGGFAQGPEEKNGRAGLRAGSGYSVIKTLLAESSRGVGTAWPAGRNRGVAGQVKLEK